MADFALCAECGLSNIYCVVRRDFGLEIWLAGTVRDNSMGFFVI